MNNMSNVKIIIADDNKTLAELLKTYIEKNSNYKVLGVATSSKQQIELTNGLDPDVIITDIERKDEEISGLDFILDSENKNRKEKYIIVTASAKEEVLMKNNFEMPSNVLEYIRKPFDFEKILTILNNIDLIN